MQNRIEVFRQMLDADPENTMVMFGLAKEYEKLGQHQEIIDILETYLAKADDEGNAYGVLAKAYDQIRQPRESHRNLQKRHRRLNGPRPPVDGERIPNDARSGFFGLTAVSPVRITSVSVQISYELRL